MSIFRHSGNEVKHGTSPFLTISNVASAICHHAWHRATASNSASPHLCRFHIFTDTSISAFSAVIYACQPPSATAPARLVFVLGKSQVAPIKQRSVPKLELEPPGLRVRLLRTVRNASECNFRQIIFWTDSCVVLDWIQNEKKSKTFVAHRVDEIVEIVQHTNPKHWNYVPT